MTDARKIMRDAPDSLLDLFESVSTAAVAAGLDREKADKIGLEVVDILAAAWGGQAIYFAKNTHINLRQRDLNIYREFNGSNHAELAVKYNVSIVWVYAIIKRVRDSIRSDSQMPLL